MPQPVPAPVLGFFARFLANPDSEGLRKFQIDLLDLEVSRAQYNTLSDPDLFDLPTLYRSDIARAQHALDRVRSDMSLDEEQLDLRYNWLTLLGNRLAAERGLRAEGTTTLAFVASARLNRPFKETENWSEARLFRRYTETVLRDEWDYPGIQFRYRGSAWPPEAR